MTRGRKSAIMKRDPKRKKGHVLKVRIMGYFGKFYFTFCDMERNQPKLKKKTNRNI